MNIIVDSEPDLNRSMYVEGELSVILVFFDDYKI